MKKDIIFIAFLGINKKNNKVNTHLNVAWKLKKKAHLL